MINEINLFNSYQIPNVELNNDNDELNIPIPILNNTYPIPIKRRNVIIFEFTSSIIFFNSFEHNMQGKTTHSIKYKPMDARKTNNKTNNPYFITRNGNVKKVDIKNN